MPRNHYDNRGSKIVAAIILDTEGTSNTLIYVASHTIDAAAVMMIQQSRHPKGPEPGSSFCHFTTMVSSMGKMDCCRLYLVHSHCTST